MSSRVGFWQLDLVYSQSGIEHVHVQYKMYKKGKKDRTETFKSTQTLDNFPYRLLRIYIGNTVYDVLLLPMNLVLLSELNCNVCYMVC